MGSIILIENWIKDFNFLFDFEFQIEYINPAFRMIVRCTMFCFNLRYLINDCKKHDKIFYFLFWMLRNLFRETSSNSGCGQHKQLTSMLNGWKQVVHSGNPTHNFGCAPLSFNFVQVCNKLPLSIGKDKDLKSFLVLYVGNVK